MRFRYEALDGGGTLLKGSLDAAGEAEGIAALREQGLFPTRLLPGESLEAKEGRSGIAWPVTSGDKSLFMGQLALMLRSGLTLLTALETLARTSAKPRLRACARRLATSLREGRPLSSALEQEPLFPTIVARLTATAEATGELETAFERAGVVIERRSELRRQLVTSLSYPTLVVVAALSVFVFLTTQVVPKFAALLASRGVALPWTTQALLDLSSLLVNHGPAVLVVVSLGVLSLIAAWRQERGRAVMEGVLFRVPVIGSVLQAAAMAHVLSTLSLLLRSGLPLLESLQVLVPTVASQRFRALLERAHSAVLSGATLARALEDPLFPSLGRQVVAVGEETGALDEVAARLGAFYDQRLERLLKTLSSLVEPALLIVIGGMVGFVYFSFFQALFRVAAR